MNCPICESDNKKTIYRLCDNMKVMGLNFPESPAYVAKCEKCGLVYMDTDATQDDFLAYYKHGAIAPRYYEMFGEKDTDDYYEHLYKLISPYIKKDSKILDIAGAWGEFAGFLIRKGCRNVTVLDPNEKCVNNAQDIGAKVIKTDSTAMGDVADQSFDLIILNHSLEHILDVKSTMNNISKVLSDDGILFIEIPNASGYTSEEAAPFNFFTYEHVLHMTMNDLENLSGKFGFAIIRKGEYYKKVSNYPSIYSVMKKGKGTEVAYSDDGENAILEYIRKSENVLEQFLKPLRDSGEELVLWGIGASTAILIESFRGCNVRQLIDKNPSRQGLIFTINNEPYRVEAPENVKDGTIVILSIPYHDSIEKQIRQMGLNNKIVALK